MVNVEKCARHWGDIGRDVRQKKSRANNGPAWVPSLVQHFPRYAAINVALSLQSLGPFAPSTRTCTM